MKNEYSSPSIKDLVGSCVPYFENHQFESESIELSVQSVSKDQARLACISGAYSEYYGFTSGNYTVLKVKNSSEVIMSDTMMEVRTNYHFIRNANGHVLIAGFGIGLVVMAIQNNPLVKKITIIEFNKEVIDNVASKLPLNSKVQIIEGDIFGWKPYKNEKFDTIYFDIWNTICADNYPSMKFLHRRFGRRVQKNNPKSFIRSWRKEDCYRLYKSSLLDDYHYLDGKNSALQAKLE